MANRKKPKKVEIAFDFIKSNYFRVIHVDGAFGGLAPNGAIHMSVFSQRHPIPKKVVHELDGAKLGPELLNKREVRKAIVREVEADLVLNIGEAILLRDWLDSRIQEHQRIIAQTKQNAKGKTNGNGKGGSR